MNDDSRAKRKQRENRIFVLAFVVFVSWFGLSVLSHSQVFAAELSRDEIYARVAPSTVLLKAQDDAGDTKANGFFIKENVVIAPVYFVKEGIDARKNAQINFIGQEEKYPVTKVLAIDDVHAIALLLVPGTSARALRMAEGDIGKSGGLAYIIGDHIFKSGPIAADTSHKGKFILKASISPGNAGSPILNTMGEVIGVSTGGLNSVGYSVIPLSEIKALLSRGK